MHPELQALVESGPLAYLTTLNRDGGPQVTMIWIGLDEADPDVVVSGHMNAGQKVKNLQRDGRFALSFQAPSTPGEFLAPHAVLRGTAEVVPDAPAGRLLHRLGRVYVAPDFVFPQPEDGTGFLIRYHVDRVGGVGPWAS